MSADAQNPRHPRPDKYPVPTSAANLAASPCRAVRACFEHIDCGRHLDHQKQVGRIERQRNPGPTTGLAPDFRFLLRAPRLGGLMVGFVAQVGRFRPASLGRAPLLRAPRPFHSPRPGNRRKPRIAAVSPQNPPIRLTMFRLRTHYWPPGVDGPKTGHFSPHCAISHIRVGGGVCETSR